MKFKDIMNNIKGHFNCPPEMKKVNDDMKCYVYEKDNEAKSVVDLEGLVLETVDFNFQFDVRVPVVIKKCIIKAFLVNTGWFKKGLIIDSCIFLNDIEYQMGGHNEKEIAITNNVFCGFFDFFDCHFENDVIVKSNNFIMGTNLMGNKGTGYYNSFENKIIVENNLGKTDVDY